MRDKQQHKAKLTLVGAGPGDPELITLKAINALRNANVVMYDALVDKSLLDYAPQAIHVFVGKRGGKQYLSQDDINHLIVQNAQNHGHVVRLKGGDSFVFGRYVNDEEVWTEILSNNLKEHVLNYGVGNYGFDQALLRYEKNKHINSKYTIIGVVPETINRIHSIWKHYLEFGNIYGFKPSFFLNGEKLKLRKNPIKKKSDFKKKKIASIINSISKNDIFYERKFKKFQFRKPFLISFFRNFNFNTRLFAKILCFLFAREKDKKKYLFPLFYSNNIELANKLYTERSSTKLFELLIKRFKKIAEKKNSTPIIIIFPQKRDIELFKMGKNYSCNFFNSMQDIKIINLTKFLSKKNIKKIFLDEEHGGHLTPHGNKIVAKQIQQELYYD